MNRFRADSSPELISHCTSELQKDSNIEGAAANVKLLLKLIQDYPNVVSKDDGGGQKPQRVTGMISILDDVRTRIQRFQTPVRTEARELRRCNTDLRRGGYPPANPREKKAAVDHPITLEESQRLQRELSANVTARRSLEKMFSGLGKEKEIIAAELARKVAQLSAMEELVGDLRAQNEMLTEKVKVCAAEHKGLKKNGDCGGDSQQANAALQERNKLLSEQLLKSLDGYRTMKRRLKDAQEERATAASKMAKAAEDAAAAVEIVRALREKMDVEGGDRRMQHEDEAMASLEQVLVGLQQRMAKLSSCRGPN